MSEGKIRVEESSVTLRNIFCHRCLALFFPSEFHEAKDNSSVSDAIKDSCGICVLNTFVKLFMTRRKDFLQTGNSEVRSSELEHECTASKEEVTLV